MQQTGDRISVVESCAQDTYDWLDRVGLELDDDRHLALCALRAVLHALRDHLSVEQNAHLAAQFPTFIRGLYFEQWTPDAPSLGRDRELFLAAIERHMGGYEDRCSGEEAAVAVFIVLGERLSGGAEKIRNALPTPIRDLWY